MSIVDRYLCSVFVKTFSGLLFELCRFVYRCASCLVTWTNSIRSPANLVGQAVFLEFYLPRVADMYDKSAGILILISAVFSVSLLQRRREMTAMEAAGLTKLRILRPIFILSFILIGLTIANRELLIPRLKMQLVQTPQSWGDTGQGRHVPAN